MKHVRMLAILLAMLACLAPAMAQDTGTTDATAAVEKAAKANTTDTMTVTETEAAAEMADGTVIVEGTQTVEVDEEPNFLTMELNYTYASRYIWRGREKFNGDNSSCNNQYTISGSMDIAQAFGAEAGTLGRLNGVIFFQTGDNTNTRDLQEVDYTVSYGYDFDEIGMTAEVGFIYYAYPGNSGWNTQELFIKLGVNDGLIMQALGIGDGTPLLNPTFAVYFDIDEAAGGTWTEMGMSHDFVLAELGCADMAVLKDLTLGANMTLGWACGYPESNNGGNSYYHNDTNSGMTQNFGLTADLDLQSMLDLPDCMAMNLGAFMNYTCSMDSNRPYVDELWGGVSLTVGF
jgi:uncharacterized protein YdeI (BOF family)